ncbi:TetR/AcrR family transcriptional regulator [Naasia lichenicola]|uniref:TetR/AcrR family transcriptional regulator n=1 Tax=Naasia lichenicola TaxID=2565933 RepID=A0A4S4FGI2_9MICO|nr:TetR/AcrR family transcriptional regulator [Naasia lichenicola]THG29359.1 TetR/AcrR family transcriptional regulator [Naasia lichenicola]
MPTPDRTSRDAIVLAARELLETDGLGGLTMNAVAQVVGVRAPSLYKRVDSRDRLIQLVAEATLTELSVLLDGTSDLAEAARTFRDFGRQRPAAFQLVMTPGPGTPSAGAEFGAAASAPILRIAAQLAGEQHALAAARMFTAWVSGFVSMEINGGFQLGGDLEEAWEFGVTGIRTAITASR